MEKARFLKQITEFAKVDVNHTAEIEELFLQIKKSPGTDLDIKSVKDFFETHKKLYMDFSGFLLGHDSKAGERTFDIYKEYPLDVKKRLRLADSEVHYKNWADTLKSVPKKTTPLPVVTGNFIKKAKKIWADNVCGNEEILKVLLRHMAEYSKTGKTTPVLLVGEPGIGKTLIAKSYGDIMGLPYVFISGPSASVNRGLAGAPNLYAGAGAGAVVQAMISSKAGNPVIVIDEIEKAVGGFSGNPHFQDELLAALDESNTHWHDNFLEMDLDASHIPYIFTANSKENISRPLLDRMEIVEMKAPTREMMHSIAKDYTLPKVLETYSCDQIHIADNAIHYLVDSLWKNENCSCRLFQKAVNILVSDAYINMLESERPVHITMREVEKAVVACVQANAPRKMGFVTR